VIYGCGSQTNGIFGKISSSPQATARSVLLSTNKYAIQVSSAHTHVLALDYSGTLLSWGSNGYGELGVADIYMKTVPTVVTVVQGIKIERIAACYNTSFIYNTKQLFAWGDNTTDQIGWLYGDPLFTPVSRVGTTDLNTVAAVVSSTGGALVACILITILMIILCVVARRKKRSKQRHNNTHANTPEKKEEVAIQIETEFTPLVIPTVHTKDRFANPRLVQQNITELIRQIANHVQMNQFEMVEQLSNNIRMLVLEYGTVLPNPFHAFISLVRITEYDTFRYASSQGLEPLLYITHLYAILSLHEIVLENNRIDDQDKKFIINKLTTLAEIKQKGTNYNVTFLLECIRQCVLLMSDTSSNAVKLFRAVSNVQNPSRILEQVISELLVVPSTWYEEILSLQLHLLRTPTNGEQLFVELSELFTSLKKLDWRVWYYCIGMFNDVMDLSNTEKMASLMLFNESISDDITLEKIRQLSTSAPAHTLVRLSSFDGARKKTSARIRAQCARQLLKIVQTNQHVLIRKVTIFILLHRRIHEIEPKVVSELETIFKKMEELGLVDIWRDVAEPSLKIAKTELDTEWNKISIKRAKLNELRELRTKEQKKYKIVETELNLLHEQVKQRDTDMLRMVALEKEIKICEKEEELEDDEQRSILLAKKRMESQIERTRLLNQINNVNTQRIEELKQELEAAPEKTKQLESQIEKKNDKITEMQKSFNLKREHFEQLRDDYHLAVRLELHDLEAKMNDVEMYSKANLTKKKKSELICPITQRPPQVPVKLQETGHVYEKEAIETWFVNHDTNPATGLTLKDKTLIRVEVQ
jgi:hypothetical protein